MSTVVNKVPGTLGLTEEQQNAVTQKGENQRITGGDYDKALAVKCVNGTFVGRKTENVIAYKGIPFVRQQPVGELRWKAPTEVVPDDGIYEAYYFGKTACQDRELSGHQGEDCLYTVDTAKADMVKIQEQLLSEGYTMYIDGWGNYFYNDHFYQGARQVDEAGDMHFVLGLSYEIESWMDIDQALDKADEARKYASAHVAPNWVKLFMDGTVEGGTGFVDPLYPDGHQGLVNWTEEETTDITRKVNEKGMSMHIHTMGNKAVNRAVSAFVDGGKDDMRNTIVHVRNVSDTDWKRMAEHNIYATAGILWHNMETGVSEFLKTIVPAGMEDKSYPIKSYYDYGINVSSHTDYPALSGCPDDPFGIMEIAVTVVHPTVKGDPWWPEERLTREQALTTLTIGCARQMFIEDERGSVCEGKYADFLLVDKDVLSCPENDIHTARPLATYFEGQKVFSA